MNEQEKETIIEDAEKFEEQKLELSKLESLILPIPGDHPCGEDLRYEGIYDKISEARREDDATLPQGVWERQLKRADWKEVIKICTDALKNRTKDLQIAVWLMEALMNVEGFAGAKQGLNLIFSMCENFWDNLHPQIIENDIETRISPFIWINEKLSLKIKMLPITMPQSKDVLSYTFSDWESAEMLEKQASKDKNVMEKAELEGRVTRAKFLGSVMFSPRSFYESQSQSLHSCLDLLISLDNILYEKCGKEAPSLSRFRGTIEEICALADKFLQEKINTNAEEESQKATPEMTTQDRINESRTGTAALSIRNRGQAYHMLSAAADYLLMNEPHSPTPYLVKRAVSWGHMSLTELLHELIHDEHDLQQILKLLGQKGPLSK